MSKVTSQNLVLYTVYPQLVERSLNISNCAILPAINDSFSTVINEYHIAAHYAYLSLCREHHLFTRKRKWREHHMFTRKRKWQHLISSLFNNYYVRKYWREIIFHLLNSSRCVESSFSVNSEHHVDVNHTMLRIRF